MRLKDRKSSAAEKTNMQTQVSPGWTKSLFSLGGMSASAQTVFTPSLPSEDELIQTRSNGSFEETEPSELFSKIYFNVRNTLYKHPASNLSSPDIAGSTGVIPVTIISTVPDIADYYHTLIVNAQVDVLIFSNFWKDSYAAQRIGSALRELSNKIGNDRREKVVVKILFDRGSVKHLLETRIKVGETEWVAIGLPRLKEISNIDFHVVNYHNFPVGTFHSKFMVVDRKIAVVNSCNIQDNSNLEMLTHLEGPIVDSIYQHAMVTWGTRLNPAVPSLTSKKTETLDPEILNTDLQTPDFKTLQDVNSTLNTPSTPKPSPTALDDLLERPFFPIRKIKTKRFPIALVNRPPYASPDNASLETPQNVAWLSAIKFAKDTIFIQTPDLNAEPLIPALLSAVKRGVTVTMILCLGYNDLGEMLPLQGGHNEAVVARMKNELESEEKKRLKVHWYVGRDMKEPIHATKNIRTCHIKLMIVDGQVGIQGSGNQDTQSWFHSQEINYMADNQELCKAWMEQLMGNQNSFVYGAGSEIDGLWRDENGKQAVGSIGLSSGIMAWQKGASALIGGKIGSTK